MDNQRMKDKYVFWGVGVDVEMIILLDCDSA